MLAPKRVGEGDFDRGITSRRIREGTGDQADDRPLALARDDEGAGVGNEILLVGQGLGQVALVVQYLQVGRFHQVVAGSGNAQGVRIAFTAGGQSDFLHPPGDVFGGQVRPRRARLASIELGRRQCLNVLQRSLGIELSGLSLIYPQRGSGSEQPHQPHHRNCRRQACVLVEQTADVDASLGQKAAQSFPPHVKGHDGQEKSNARIPGHPGVTPPPGADVCQHCSPLWHVGDVDDNRHHHPDLANLDLEAATQEGVEEPQFSQQHQNAAHLQHGQHQQGGQ